MGWLLFHLCVEQQSRPVPLSLSGPTLCFWHTKPTDKTNWPRYTCTPATANDTHMLSDNRLALIVSLAFRPKWIQSFSMTLSSFSTEPPITPVLMFLLFCESKSKSCMRCGRRLVVKIWIHKSTDIISHESQWSWCYSTHNAERDQKQINQRHPRNSLIFKSSTVAPGAPTAAAQEYD